MKANQESFDLLQLNKVILLLSYDEVSYSMFAD